jgi:hypothetical protein
MGPPWASIMVRLINCTRTPTLLLDTWLAIGEATLHHNMTRGLL